jgi:hypothetical protein
MTTIFFHLSLLLLFFDLGSKIRDGMGKSGSGIRDKHPGSATLIMEKKGIPLL